MFGDDAWLQHRLTFFEKFCLPSVLGQTRQDFTWVLFYSVNSPSWVGPYLSTLPRPDTVAIALDEVASSHVFARYLTSLKRNETPTVITSRLDSDDALAENFVERLRDGIERSSAQAINFSFGLRLTAKGLLTAKDYSSPFVSLVEDTSIEPLRTVYSRSHEEVTSAYPSLQLSGDPGWMQVIHGRNVLNKPAGLPSGPRRYRHLFPGLDTTPQWTPLSYWTMVRPERVLKRRLQERLKFQR